MMTDRMKYIEVLSKTAKTVKEFNEDAPIKISLECIEDILELMKEQEAVEPYQHDAVWICGNCDKEEVGWDDPITGEEIRYPFCRECGRSVKWDA